MRDSVSVTTTVLIACGCAVVSLLGGALIPAYVTGQRRDAQLERLQAQVKAYWEGWSDERARLVTAEAQHRQLSGALKAARGKVSKFEADVWSQAHAQAEIRDLRAKVREAQDKLAQARGEPDAQRTEPTPPRVSPPPPAPSRPSRSALRQLSADVSFTGTQVVVLNKDGFAWRDVKLAINRGVLGGGYVYRVNAIGPGEKVVIGVMQFTKSGGTRLNPLATKPQSLDITVFGNPSGARGSAHFAFR